MEITIQLARSATQQENNEMTILLKIMTSEIGKIPQCRLWNALCTLREHGHIPVTCQSGPWTQLKMTSALLTKACEGNGMAMPTVT